LAQLLPLYVDAIYKDVPGATFDSSSGAYLVPCNAALNVSFVFNGTEYPVHPIDTVQAGLDNGELTCFGGFMSNGGQDNAEDMILGDSFLRNVYAVFNYGDFIDNSTTALPFIQLLSKTDQAQAFGEFETLSSQRNASIAANAANSTSSNGPSSPTSPSSPPGSSGSHSGSLGIGAYRGGQMTTTLILVASFVVAHLL